MNQPIESGENYKYHQYPSGMLYIQIPAHLALDFKLLIQRGANLWPDASPEIKELTDLITNGKVMQNYYKQSGKKANHSD